MIFAMVGFFSLTGQPRNFTLYFYFILVSIVAVTVGVFTCTRFSIDGSVLVEPKARIYPTVSLSALC